MRYAVELTPDDNGTLLVTVPDLPEAITFGGDREEAFARAVDAIESALMGAIAARETIAEPKARGADYVTLPALASAKLALYRATRAERVGKALRKPNTTFAMFEMSGGSGSRMEAQ